jgi:hypothetical protein
MQGRRRMHGKGCLERLSEKHYLKDLGLNGKLLLKLILKKENLRTRPKLIWFKAGCFEIMSSVKKNREYLAR